MDMQPPFEENAYTPPEMVHTQMHPDDSEYADWEDHDEHAVIYDENRHSVFVGKPGIHHDDLMKEFGIGYSREGQSIAMGDIKPKGDFINHGGFEKYPEVEDHVRSYFDAHKRSDDDEWGWKFGMTLTHHNWTPGNHGKGFLKADGTPVTWNLDDDYEYDQKESAGPHHAEVAEEMGLSEDPIDNRDGEGGNWHTPIYINPDGVYNKLGYWPEALHEDGGQFEKAGLKSAGPGWHFGNSNSKDEEEPDFDDYLEQEGWLDPRKTFDHNEPLRHVDHEMLRGDHYEVNDPDSPYYHPDDGEQTEIHEKPILFDGKRFYAGKPNAFHWDMIEHDPELKEQFNQAQSMRTAPDQAMKNPASLAYGRWNEEHNEITWYQKGKYRRDHLDQLSNQTFGHPYDTSEEMGHTTDEDDGWHFGKIGYADDPNNSLTGPVIRNEKLPHGFDNWREGPGKVSLMNNGHLYAWSTPDGVMTRDTHHGDFYEALAHERGVDPRVVHKEFIGDGWINDETRPLTWFGGEHKDSKEHEESVADTLGLAADDAWHFGSAVKTSLDPFAWEKEFHGVHRPEDYQPWERGYDGKWIAQNGKAHIVVDHSQHSENDENKHIHSVIADAHGINGEFDAGWISPDGSWHGNVTDPSNELPVSDKIISAGGKGVYDDPFNAWKFGADQGSLFHQNEFTTPPVAPVVPTKPAAPDYGVSQSQADYWKVHHGNLLNWSPNSEHQGRCLVLDNGNVITWNCNARWEPYHGDVAYDVLGIGWGGDVVIREVARGYIETDGSVTDCGRYAQKVQELVNPKAEVSTGWKFGANEEGFWYLEPDGKILNYQGKGGDHSDIASQIPGTTNENGDKWRFGTADPSVPNWDGDKEEPWEPGHYGKGLITHSRGFQAWKVDNGGNPGHGNVDCDPDWPSLNGDYWGHGFHINPEGEVNFWCEAHPEAMDEARQAPGVTEVKDAGAAKWHFNKVATFDYKPWEPGNYGKCLLTKSGDVHHWTTEHEQDGRPYHADYQADKNVHNNSVVTAGWISPNGSLSALNEEHVPTLVKAIPGTEGGTTAWHFGSNEQWPEPPDPNQNWQSIKTSEGKWHFWQGDAHAVHMLKNQIEPHQVETYASYAEPHGWGAPGWHDHTSMRDSYEAIHKGLVDDAKDGDSRWFARTNRKNRKNTAPNWTYRKNSSDSHGLLDWEEGYDGKGLLDPHGNLHDWVDGLDHDTHLDYLVNNNLSHATAYLIIRPHGAFHGADGELSPQNIETIERQDPRLHYRKTAAPWAFG